MIASITNPKWPQRRSSSRLFHHLPDLRQTDDFCSAEHANGVSEADEDVPQDQAQQNPIGGRKPAKLQALQKKNAAAQEAAAPEPAQAAAAAPERRIVPVHQSRIADRPAKQGEKDSSLKIKIELDLEVEVELYARVKGDITIGLM